MLFYNKLRYNFANLKTCQRSCYIHPHISSIHIDVSHNLHALLTYHPSLYNAVRINKELSHSKLSNERFHSP